MNDFRLSLIAAAFLVAAPTYGAPAAPSKGWSIPSAVEEIRLVLTESTPIETSYTTTVRSIYDEKRYGESSPKVVTPYFRRPREYFYTDYDSAPVVFEARQDYGLVETLRSLLHAFIGGSDDL